ncbi:MAG TPA: hypothetical protein VIR63_00390, partial [Pontiella sp.]
KWESSPDSSGLLKTTASNKLRYLMLGWSEERWRYSRLDREDEDRLTDHHQSDGFFPLWQHKFYDSPVKDEQTESFEVLGALYDSLHERRVKEDVSNDYLRRRVLWRLYHYEKLNGDVSVDIFPGITVDTYKNGYHKSSFLWRVFRYEKDPDDGSRKLDLLFIPLLRVGGK